MEKPDIKVYQWEEMLLLLCKELNVTEKEFYHKKHTNYYYSTYSDPLDDYLWQIYTTKADLSDDEDFEDYLYFNGIYTLIMEATPEEEISMWEWEEHEVNDKNEGLITIKEQKLEEYQKALFRAVWKVFTENNIRYVKVEDRTDEIEKEEYDELMKIINEKYNLI